MAKVNIFKEAKRLRKEYPKRFPHWQDYVAQASAIYARKHKGQSPVGRKHPPKKKSMGKTTRKKAQPKRKSARKRKVGATHVAAPRSRKSGITVGAVNQHAKSARQKLEQLIGMEEVKKFVARKKPLKRKIQKKITSYKAAYRRLAAKI